MQGVGATDAGIVDALRPAPCGPLPRPSLAHTHHTVVGGDLGEHDVIGALVLLGHESIGTVGMVLRFPPLNSSSVHLGCMVTGQGRARGEGSASEEMREVG